MSRYQTVYCGPYAQFHYPHKTEPEAWERCEPCATSRRRHRDTKTLFCGACGTKFVPVEYERLVPPNVYRALGDADRMCELYLNEDGRVLCVRPNRHRCGRYMDPDGGPPLDIASVDIEAEKSRFRDLFRDDLAKLSAEYGEATICWGVHTWTS